MSADEWAGIRVYMQDRRRFQSDANAVTDSIRRMEMETNRLSSATDRSNRRSFLMNQAMFTMRRLVYSASLAVGTMAAGVVGLGLKFDSMMQTSQVAFTTLLGGAQAASDEIDFLYQLAAKTPFEFAGVQDAARQFLGWGFSVQQVNSYLTTLSNIIAAMGDTAPDVMSRVIRAFGQMRSAGVVRMQDLMQLQQAIPGIMQMLQKQLGLSPGQVANIGRLRLRSDVAIEAIMRGIRTDPRFKGAAQALQNTVQGQLSTLHDYASRLFGDIVRAPFNAINDRLPRVNKDVEQLSNTMHDAGFNAFIVQLDQMAGAGGRLSRAWNILRIYGRNFGLILKDEVFPAMKNVSDVVGAVLYPLLILLGQGLGFAAHHTTLVRVALTVLMTWLVLVRLNIFRLWVMSKTWELLWRLRLLRTIISVRRAMIITNLTMLATKARMLILAYQTARLIGGMTRMQAALAVLRIAFAGTWIAALGPVAWIIAGVALVIGALVYLYFKWGWFHDKVTMVFGWIKDHWRLLATILMAPIVGPLGIAILWFKKLKDAAQNTWKWIKDKFSLRGLLGGVGNAVGAITNPFRSLGHALHIPGLATGGFVTGSGWTLVGEQGPELRYLSRGSTVVPLDRAGDIAKPDPFEGTLEATAPIVLEVSRRVLAETVADFKLAKAARA